MDEGIDFISSNGQNELILNSDIGHNCKYVDQNEFKSMVSNKTERFSVLSLNIRSISNKLNDFSDFIEETKSQDFNFSCLCIQETWGIKNHDLVSLNNYNLISKDREGKRGGGLAIYLSDVKNYEIIKDFSCFNDNFESLIIKVFISKNKFKIVANIYRIPNSNMQVFSDWLNSTLTSLKLMNADEIILCSDLNINLIRYNEHSPTNDFLNMLISHSFLPVITLPSRITPTNATLIDNIFTNKSLDSYNGGLIYSSLSDHLPIFYLNVSNQTSNKDSSIQKRNMSKENIDNFKDSLFCSDWSAITSDLNPESAFENFSNVINKNFDKCFPFKTVKPNKRIIPQNPWMTADLLNLRKRKERLLKQKFKHKTVDSNRKFVMANNIYKSAVRKAKKEYYSSKFNEFSSNMRKTWSTINQLINKNRKAHSIPNIFTDGNRSYESFQDISEGFNNFFVDVGPRLAEDIPNCDKDFKDYLGAPVNEIFVFQNITPQIIYSTLNKLQPKLSCGPDNISTKLLKEIMPSIINPVVYLFNLSFKHGFVPNNYKCAKILPIFKSGRNDSFDNYRPISILNAFSKLLEKIVACQMFKYLNKFNILYKHQYGFRPKHNTTQPLIQLLNKIYQGLDSKTPEYTLGVFIDLKKAFDTCNVQILLSKLDHYGFKGIANGWFHSYLNNRTQYVEINGIKSSIKNITHGVPQGSVLGPILFLLYINDLPNAIDIFSSLFADDTIFAHSDSNLNRLEERVNMELEKSKLWFQANKLSLNVAKTKFMVFRTKQMHCVQDSLNIKIGSEKIERIGNDCNIKSFKFVGVHLDEFVTWEQHINSVINKVSSANFVLNQLKQLLPAKIRKTIYNSLVKSHLEYSIIAWGSAKCEGMNRLLLKQKQAVRYVANAKYNAHVDPLLEKYDLLKLEDILLVNIGSFVKSFLTGKMPDSFNDIFQPMLSNRVMKLKVPLPKHKALETFPNVSFVKLWNNLDSNIRCSETKNSTKNLIKKKSLEKYKSFKCDKRKCFVCKKGRNLP